MDSIVPTLSPKQSWSLEDSERDLIKTDQRAEVSTKKCGTEGKPTFKEERD